MAVTHLVDTSFLKRLGIPAVRADVEPLAEAGRLARAEICDLEVGYSARNAREWDRLVGALDILTHVATTADHVLLIAAAAEEEHLAVLHYDQYFDKIAKVTGQPCQWVVPAGSID